MIELIRNYWWAVSLGVAAAISILNAITKYYGARRGGLRKALGFVVEVLSILVSQGAKVGQGPLSRFKLPGQIVPPDGGNDP